MPACPPYGLLYATLGREAEVFAEFRDDLRVHGGDPDRIGEICMDMSKAYIKGAADVFPDAEVTFDRFHVVKLLNEGIQRVRRAEQKDRLDLKRTRWLWLKNQRSLTASQMARLDELLDLATDTLETAKACELKLNFQELWALPPMAAWIQVLKDDPREIRRAAAAAQKISDLCWQSTGFGRTRARKRRHGPRSRRSRRSALGQKGAAPHPELPRPNPGRRPRAAASRWIADVYPPNRSGRPRPLSMSESSASSPCGI